LVDVRDTAIGHLLAAEHGRPGERYILGCENLTLEEILGRLAALAQKTRPKMKIPYAVAYAAGVATTAWAELTGKEPIAPLEGVRMARKKMFVTHDRASRELGFNPGPVDTALERAVAWFRANGYC
jgi:dihydroflavonol-4-reductase